MVSDVFNRIVSSVTVSQFLWPSSWLIYVWCSSCHSKCISPRYAEGDLNKGESVCIDRCVAKFFEVNKKVGEKMQSAGASAQATGSTSFSLWEWGHLWIGMMWASRLIFSFSPRLLFSLELRFVLQRNALVHSHSPKTLDKHVSDAFYLAVKLGKHSAIVFECLFWACSSSLQCMHVHYQYKALLSYSHLMKKDTYAGARVVSSWDDGID